MEVPLLTLALRGDQDFVLARQRTRQIASLLGFGVLEQTRVATAVSEIVRNASSHTQGARLEFAVRRGVPPTLEIRIVDRGRGIEALEQVRGEERAGFSIARRLVDGFHLQQRGPGAAAVLEKHLPGDRPFGTEEVRRISAELAKQVPESLTEELHRQNRELLGVLEDLTRQQEALVALNQELTETNQGVLALHDELTRELEDTNRGVLALYRELDDKAAELTRAAYLKDQFVAFLSHEVRTPLLSMLALSDLLLSGGDGPLAREQEKQVGFIRRSAQDLVELASDLLDISRVTAGKIPLRSELFTTAELFSTLRGLMRPLFHDEHVALVLEEPGDLPPLRTDQGKVAQILRNLLTNACKFTERGEVRLSASLEAEGGRVSFLVQDTGRGIEPDHREWIFELFAQVDGSRARGAGGAGLGLPLSRQLAELLGGTLVLEWSEPGRGSAFRLTVPVEHAGGGGNAGREARPEDLAAQLAGLRLLLVDDEEVARYLLRGTLAAYGCVLSEATDGPAALLRVRAERPHAMVLDVRMPGMDGFEVLERLRADPSTAGVPVVAYTGARLSRAEEARLEALGAVLVPKSGDASGRVGALLDGLARLGVIRSIPEHGATDAG